jgi:hypothetical protein
MVRVCECGAELFDWEPVRCLACRYERPLSVPHLRQCYVDGLLTVQEFEAGLELLAVESPAELEIAP